MSHWTFDTEERTHFMDRSPLVLLVIETKPDLYEWAVGDIHGNMLAHSQAESGLLESKRAALNSACKFNELCTPPGPHRGRAK